MPSAAGRAPWSAHPHAHQLLLVLLGAVAGLPLLRSGLDRMPRLGADFGMAAGGAFDARNSGFASGG
ncbi:hypothetical protein ABTY98_25405 [Streptomyces sp. NPDC096040]|uniref:hypothetical protein n=1 Tax=Streptomyces sp. NPDC096040 TaxID=3155541 RepID=UPI003320B61F